MVLVFGGSFNPPTLAHRAIIIQLNEIYNPEKIILIPNGDYYHWKTNLIDFKYRYDMTKLMVEDIKNVEVSDIENTKEFLGSYHSLLTFSKTYKDIYFVVGADHINTLHQWKNYKDLIKSFKFILLTRRPYQLDSDYLNKLGVNYQTMDFESEISSSKIRAHLNEHLNSLHPKVKAYIINNNLYKEVVI